MQICWQRKKDNKYISNEISSNDSNKEDSKEEYN